MKRILALTLALVLALTLAACGALQDKGTYSMGNDSITSIGGAIGELGARKIVSVNTSTSNGVQTNTYEYKTDQDDETQAANDIAVYFQYLLDNDGFLPMVSFDGLPYEGGIDLQFAKNSVDDGKIIILDIDYNTKGYTLVFTKGEGSEIDELNELINSIEKQETIIKQQNDLIIDISNAINEIVEGMTYEDDFYRNLLDRMVVHDKDHIDVYLNLLPHKWSYTVAKAKIPPNAENSKRNISDNDIGI